MVNKKQNNKIPYVYIYIYLKLKERAASNFNGYLPIHIVLNTMRNVIRIPKKFDYPILSQMEKYGLIRKINIIRYKILDKKIKDTEIEPLDCNRLAELITRVNHGRRLFCRDESVVNIMPSDCGKEFERLNTWFLD